MNDELKAGDRVKLTVEGTITDRYGTRLSLSKSDSIAIEADSGLEIFIETQGYLNDLGIEVVKPPLPTEDGWYEAACYPINDGLRYFPYRLAGGEWSVNNVPIEAERLIGYNTTFHRLGPVS